MTTFGCIGEFDISLEEWSSYTERLDHYMLANDVTDPGKKRSILLSTLYTWIRFPLTYQKPRAFSPQFDNALETFTYKINGLILIVN